MTFTRLQLEAGDVDYVIRIAIERIGVELLSRSQAFTCRMLNYAMTPLVSKIKQVGSAFSKHFDPMRYDQYRACASCGVDTPRGKFHFVVSLNVMRPAN